MNTDFIAVIEFSQGASIIDINTSWRIDADNMVTCTKISSIDEILLEMKMENIKMSDNDNDNDNEHDNEHDNDNEFDNEFDNDNDDDVDVDVDVDVDGQYI